MIRPTCAVLAGALLAVAACDDAAAPAGRAGSVTVAAYIDRDATGTMTEGDLPVAGFDVQLERDGEVIASATTGADGRATFADVAPGGYRVVSADEPPAGSVLSTSPSPSAVVSFQGSAPEVEFRFVHLPGTLAGRVFRNDGGTADYESGTDTPGAGVAVYLRTDQAGEPGDTIRIVTADEEGLYRFTNLAPGTYFVEFEQLGAMNYGAAGRIFPVTVTGGLEAVQSVTFTGSIFMTIAEARAVADDETVAVVGTITVPANTFTSSGGVNSEIWVQDETGGIAVFSVPSASTEYTLGRVIEVVGRKDTFNGKEQIASPTIRIRSNGTVPAALVVTGTVANSRADEGELVTIEDVEVTAVGGTATSTAYDVTTLAPDGQTVRIRVATGTGIAQGSWTIGTSYDVTGVLSEFNGTAQIQPRGTGDIVEVGAPPAPVARLIINEFLPDPRIIADDQGEYFEIHNWGTASVDLQGYSFKDHSTSAQFHVIATSLVVPAGGYVVLGLNANTATNGGVTVDYQYANIFLNNSSDGIVLKDPDGATVDSVAYTSFTSGVAWGVVDPSADNTVVGTASNWSQQTTVYQTNGTDENRGTPHAQNDGYVAPASPNRIPLPSNGSTLSRDPVAPARTTSGPGAPRR